MIFQDWHTHSSLCRHAIGNLEDYVKSAINKNLNLIGFSAHFPYEFLKSIENIPYEAYAMKLEDLYGYIREAERLKKKYENQIAIRIGFEIDYIKSQENSYKKYIKDHVKKLDYIIGSIHNLETEFGLFPFDDESFLFLYSRFDKIDEIFELYYETLKSMVESKMFKFDIIGHFDLPKKFNKKPINRRKISKLIDEILEIVKEKQIIIELNSSGLRKPVKEQYPSTEILKIMKSKEIPTLLGSDAHNPREIGYKFKEMVLILKELGFNKLANLEKRKMSFIQI